MSTIHFDAEELGNVLAYITHARFDDDGTKRVLASLLATYSRANTRAYKNAYAARHQDARDAKPCTAKELLAAKPMTANSERAVGTIGLLGYNTDDLKPKEAKALLTINERAFRRIRDTLDARNIKP